MSKKQILMLVYNHFTNDSRVLKEAFSLSKNGYNIHIFAIWEKGLEKKEVIGKNILLTRVDFTPMHKKIIGKKNFERLKQMIYGKSKPDHSLNLKKTSTVSKNTFSKKKLSSLKFKINMINKYFSYTGFYADVKKEIISNDFEQVDIIHAHDLNTLNFGVKLAKKYKAKLVYDSHELYVYRNKPYHTPKWFENWQKRREGRLIKKCDNVITVSKSIVNYLAKTYHIEKPVLVMNTPNHLSEIKLNHKGIKDSLNIKENQKIILYSGAISFNRGLDKLIESLKYIKNAHLVLMGMGNQPFKNYLNYVAKNNNVQDRFHFFGPVKPAEVTSYIKDADIGVAPIENVCLSYYFCSPNKVFEYIQGGIPVSGSNFPDLKEVIEDNNIGNTFDPEVPEDIASKLNELLKNQDLYKKMKTNVLAIKDKYKWENEEQKLISLYSKL